MKKYLYSFWAKLVALALCTVFAVGFALNLAGTIICSFLPVLEDVKYELNQTVSEQYAAQIIDVMDDENWKEQLDALADSVNMDFGVIETTEIGDEFLTESDKLTYRYQTTDKLSVSYTNSYGGVLPRMVSHYRTDSLLGALFSNPFVYEDDYLYTKMFILDLVYDTNTKLFFYKTADGYVLRTSIHLTVPIEEDGETYQQEYAFFYDEEKGAYYGDEIPTEFSEDGLFHLEDLKDKEFFLDLGANIHSYAKYENIKQEALVTNTLLYVANSYSSGDGKELSYIPLQLEEPVYWVVCQPKAELQDHDLFMEANSLLNKLYTNSNLYLINLVLCLILGLFFYGVLLYSAGRNSKEEGVMLGAFDRIPYEIIGTVAFLLELGGVMLLYALAEGVSQGMYNSNLYVNLAIVIVAIMFLIFAGVSYTTAARLKARSFWKTTMVYPLCKWSWKIVCAPFRFVIDGCRNHLGLGFKAFFILGIVSLGELYVIAMFAYDFEALFFAFLFWKMIQVPVLILTILQLKRLQEGGKRIAEGDTRPIDTRGMFWEFKKHAQNINKVGDGMKIAVDEQLKSERFRTELITNVSHDIKTPLTSIINYVDLIQKEEITDPTLVEYVEVLDRQSARLKKLIEDLMEASKASTGNLTVNKEDCDLAVMLTQTVGEFQEKLEANQLELVVNGPQEPVIVEADSRHLWRVFDNLLNNICKYSQPGTRVYVDLKVYERVVDIYFKNISRYPLNISGEELMERFVRGDSSRNTEGSGLGLSIAQSLAELMHGNLQIEIDGDLFKVRLRFPLKK